MSATERLRQILDERGIEYKTHGESYHTWYDAGGGVRITVFETDAGYLLINTCADTPEQAIDATLGPKITEDTSDGWHSFKDLYHHRALLFSVIVHTYRDMCWKSKKHHDGKELDWNFIVGIDTPWGQASYHYGMEYWDMFDCKEVERAPYYDGYTADESVERIARLVELGAPETCRDDGFQPYFFTCSECGKTHLRNVAYVDMPRYCPDCGRKVIE